MKRILTLALCLVLLLGVLPLHSLAAENPFVDVKESDWFYDAVMWAYENGVTKGVDETHFGPDSTVTRGQAVTFLHRAMGEPEPGTDENPFVDVKPSDYFYKSVLWAVALGITKGTDATHFDPKGTCSTMHIITFLYRTLGMGEDGWGQKGADWAEAEGLLRDTGLDVTNKTNCPRAAVVTTLDRTVGDAANLTQLPEGVEVLGEDPAAEKSTTVTGTDSALLTVDTVDVVAGVATPVSFELTSSLYVDSFSLLLNGVEAGTLTDEDGDGVYTGSFTVDRSVNAVLRFKARASVVGSTLESNEVRVTVRKPISAATEQTIDEVLPAVEGLMQTATDGLPADATEEQKAKARADAIYSYLDSLTGYWEEGDPDFGDIAGRQKWVPGKVDELHRDGYSISYTIDDIHFGAECMEREADIEGGGSGGGELEAEFRNDNKQAQSWYTTTREQAIVLGHFPKDSNETMAKSALALVDVLKNAGYDVTERYNFTPDDFKDLQDFAVIIVRSHGKSCRICTNIKVTKENKKTYATDIQNNLISIQSYSNGTFYDIEPAFFTHYYTDAGQSLSARWVHFGMCQGRLRDDLVDAVTEAGADCVTAFTQSVYTTYSTAVIKPLMEKLLAGKTMDDAVAEVKDEFDADDRYWTKDGGGGKPNSNHSPAALAIAGEEDMQIHAQLRNGSFEEQLSLFLFKISYPWRYWRWAGNGKPVNRLGGYAVYGNYAAFISTGDGSYDNETESLFCQPILIPEDATTISFNYRVFSEEPAKPVGTPRNDHFYAALVDVNGKTQKTLLNFGVLSYRERFSKKGDILNAGQACYVMDSWYRKTTDVSAYRGKVVNLCFWVRDFNGNAYDTAVLIDEITIQ